MQQEKLRRGLATSAVGALTITGLAVAAGPAQAADGDGARLVSQANGKASTRADGTFPPNVTIDLVAERLDANATLQFEVNADPDAGDASPGWTPVGPADTVDQRFYRHRWDGTLDGESMAGSSVALRVAATRGGETTYSTRHHVAITDQGSDVHSVALSTVGRGYFVQPYADSERTGTMVAVAGTTSATSGNVQLAWWRSSDGTYRGTTNAAVSPWDVKLPDGGGTIPGGRFSAALDITGYDAAASDDALAVRAQRGTDSVGAVEPVYQQQVESIRSGVGETTSKGTRVSLEVEDTEQFDIAGAEVRRLSDGSLVGYTDGDGTVTALQGNETTESYYVNTTDVDAFEAGVDIAVEVETPAYEPYPSGTKVVLADGAVFDDDEYRKGDVALQVVDQEGTPLKQAGVEISYALHRAGTAEPELRTATTNQAGRVVVPFDPSGRDGRYRLAYTDAGSDVPATKTTTFVAGDARLRLTPARGTAPSGGKITYVGRLVVGRVPLPGRRISLSYLRGTEQAPGRHADAGLGPRRTKAGKVRTRKDGSFKVTVVDRRENGRPAETGVLRAVAAAADEKASARARFVRKRRG